MLAVFDFREKNISGTSLGDDDVISYKNQKTLQIWRRIIYIVQNYSFFLFGQTSVLWGAFYTVELWGLY